MIEKKYKFLCVQNLFSDLVEGEQKLKINFISEEVPDDKNIKDLKNWFDKFLKNNLIDLENNSLGLSFRTDDGFIITAKDSFVLIFNYDVYNNTLFVEGKEQPPLESIMHYLIYNTRGEMNVIFHGHHNLIVKNANKLKLPVTKNDPEPGTMEFANEVLDIIGDNNFVIIKNHGFVSLGRTMKEAGELALSILKKAQSLK